MGSYNTLQRQPALSGSIYPLVLAFADEGPTSAGHRNSRSSPRCLFLIQRNMHAKK